VIHPVRDRGAPTTLHQFSSPTGGGHEPDLTSDITNQHDRHSGGSESSSGGAIITLDDHGDLTPGSGNPEPESMASFATATISCDDLPLDKPVYMNMHLDYGLKKTPVWSKLVQGDGEAASGSLNIPDSDSDSALSNLVIGQPQTYSFSLSNGFTHVQTVQSLNEFKKFAGFGGTVADCDANPVAGVFVKIVWSGGQILGSPAPTETNGNYLVVYKHTGKEAPYTLTVVDGNGDPMDDYDPAVVPVKSNKFAIVNFVPTSTSCE
jgi:hypothetical protein